MKKASTLVLSLFLMVSCSNDNENDLINPSYSNLAGTWYVNKTIQPDGTLKDYVGSCSQKRDYFVIANYARKIDGYLSYPDCQHFYSDLDTDNYYIDENDTIRLGGDFFRGKVRLRKSSLRLDYAETRTFWEDSLGEIKGAILVRE